MNVLDLNDFCIGTPPAQRMEQGRPLLDKGKPAARRGRKATGQAASLTAELPKEGGDHPPERGLPQGRPRSCSTGAGCWVSDWSWAEFSSRQIQEAPASSTHPGLLPPRIPMG